MFLGVSATNVHLGMQLRHLSVFPQTVRPEVEPDRWAGGEANHLYYGKQLKWNLQLGEMQGRTDVV